MQKESLPNHQQANKPNSKHYEKPKIKIFFILFFLFQILFLYLLTKQTRYLNFKKNRYEN
jgi:hypothetical protein